MIIKSIEIERFRAFENVSFALGKRLTAISGRNATQKTTVLGMIGQPFTISKNHIMYGCKTIDGYNFRSQFGEKFKISPTYDVIGSHKWILNLYPNIYSEQSYTVESTARREKGKAPTLRFWNAKSRKKGAGYIQLPVYYLSLSRLYPIGESGKTQPIQIELTDEEKGYCLDKYRTILSIQDNGSSSVGLEKGASSITFSGVTDQTHDIFTNSAGEGNITRIILAILSFKRLKENYGNEYKGGILLIDEIDSTLYGFSQMKLVEYLNDAAKEFKIQIIFTTHSPIVLKSVNKLQREELREKGINLPPYAYNSSIVYLEPKYASDGKRTIMPKNISSSQDFNQMINDINLTVPTQGGKVSVYCEDLQAVTFVKYLLTKKLSINLDLYMEFVDINLGWTNYIQLIYKKVPEFRKNMIILDGDVPQKSEYKNKKKIVEEAKNVIFLPLVIERDFFIFLKNHSNFNDFLSSYCSVAAFNYDICFNNWPLESSKYTTNDYKQWFLSLTDTLGDNKSIYDFWLDKNPEMVNGFTNEFIETFNQLADINEVDGIPVRNEENIG